MTPENPASAPDTANDPVMLTAEELAALRARAAKAEQLQEQWLRTAADFENFRKRVTREREDDRRYAFQPLLERLLPILDNLDMALSATTSASAASLESLQAGVTMIQNQLRTTLRESGLEELDASGKTFDPNLHEAVSQQDTTAVPEGTVVQQLRKGYRFRDRLVRPASVVVARQPAA